MNLIRSFKGRKSRFAAFFLLLMCLTLLTPDIADAAVPYKTYTVDGYGYVTETQTAYTPLKAITKIGDTSLITPMDIAISKDGYIYIADQGARMVLIADLDGNEIGRIGEGILKMPTGVYVREDKTVFVADKEAQKIFVFSPQGELIDEYGKPTSPLYGNMDFKPIKVVANTGGTIYAISEGNTNGIVQISPAEGGTFLGYFGTNFTYLNIFQIFQRAILTDAQRAQLRSNTPQTPTNLAMNEEGLIFTVTQGNGENSLSKLNIAGRNMIEPTYYDELPVAVTTGNYENILVATNDGFVYEYNEEGELLFIFGGRDDGRARIGLCKKVEAIGVDANDRIYLLDSEKKQIHVFEPTEYTDLLHEALYLYSKGRYEESKEPLEKVLEMNSLFDYANMAMARAYLQEEDFSQSLKYARLGKDYDTYSEAFWEIRNVWLRENIVGAIGLIILLLVLIKVLKKLQEKKGIFNAIIKVFSDFTSKTLVKQIRYSKYFIRHPLDGCYGVRREGKASFLCANILIASYIIISIVNKYYCGFLYKGVMEGRYDLVGDIGSVIVIFIALVSCNYLVVTINDGEGSFKQLYSAYAYCLTPYIFLLPVRIIVSNLATNNEFFIIQLIDTVMMIWMVVLVLLTIKEINNYSVKETTKVIFLTIFTVLIGALIVFIIYLLLNQASDFVMAIFREVVYRLGS